VMVIGLQLLFNDLSHPGRKMKDHLVNQHWWIFSKCIDETYSVHEHEAIIISGLRPICSRIVRNTCIYSKSALCILKFANAQNRRGNDGCRGKTTHRAAVKMQHAGIPTKFRNRKCHTQLMPSYSSMSVRPSVTCVANFLLCDISATVIDDSRGFPLRCQAFAIFIGRPGVGRRPRAVHQFHEWTWSWLYM
jgi:hypothetical protein